mgnify:CR=1 FL=1
MDTNMYEKYIDKYGNFSYILNIEIDNSVSEYEKNIILYDIYGLNYKNLTIQTHAHIILKQL